MLLKESEREAAAAERTSRRLGALATQLGILTTVLAAVATLTALPDAVTNWVTAVTAFLAALSAGITTTLKPQDRARDAQARAVEWRELQNRVRQLVRRPDRTSRYPELAMEAQLVWLEFVRDNLRRRAAGLAPLSEPPSSVRQANPIQADMS